MFIRLFVVHKKASGEGRGLTIYLTLAPGLSVDRSALKQSGGGVSRVN
jgi:hypothetical protein